MMTAAQTLADFAVKLQFEQIPQAVAERAKDCLIDIVGVCAFGSTVPSSKPPQILVTDGIGGSPYGPGTVAGPDGSRQPVEAELTTARNLGIAGSRLPHSAGS
jgi:2-methylcitrate dehydratase PrpD